MIESLDGSAASVFFTGPAGDGFDMLDLIYDLQERGWMDKHSSETVSYFIWYRGSPQTDLLEYYETHHCEILRQLPGLADLILREPVSSEDPFPVVRDQTFLMVELRFESEAALERALNSKIRLEARLDMDSFPPFEADVTHLAMRERVLFHAGR